MKRILVIILCVAMLISSVPAVVAEETVPVEPVPTEPAESTDPTESAEPTDPTESADPTEPTEPTAPTDPGPSDVPEVPEIPVRPPRPTKETHPNLSDSELLIEQLAWDVFTASQQSAGRDSFDGHCGNFVSHQLLNMGINRYKSTRHGKDHYDYYSKLEKTTGGYFPRAYPAGELQLTDALNYITNSGAKDVYNVMVGFDWTSSEAGNKYGHVVLIYGIVGGKVYFSESYDLYYKWKTYPEGSLIKLSIEDFVNYYDGWTRYEGIVVFGTKDYIDSCDSQNTSLLLQTRFDTMLRSMPCQVGKNKCKLLRNISAGERLQAFGVFENNVGEQFYRIADGGFDGFVSVKAVSVLQANPADLTITKITMPSMVSAGQAVELAGTVVGEYTNVRGLTVQICDNQNQLLQEQSLEYDAEEVRLETLSGKLKFQELPSGFYTLKIYGDVVCPTAEGDLQKARGFLGSRRFRVKGINFASRVMPRRGYRDETDVFGWKYQDGWYYYEEDTPKTGWLTWCGVQYYFDEQGRAVTGWNTIDKKLYYFSAAGCLVKNSTLKKGRTTYALDAQGVATKVKK